MPPLLLNPFHNEITWWSKWSKNMNLHWITTWLWFFDHKFFLDFLIIFWLLITTWLWICYKQLSKKIQPTLSKKNSPNAQVSTCVYQSLSQFLNKHLYRTNPKKSKTFLYSTLKVYEDWNLLQYWEQNKILLKMKLVIAVIESAFLFFFITQLILDDAILLLFSSHKSTSSCVSNVSRASYVIYTCYPSEPILY